MSSEKSSSFPLIYYASLPEYPREYTDGKRIPIVSSAVAKDPVDGIITKTNFPEKLLLEMGGLHADAAVKFRHLVPESEEERRENLRVSDEHARIFELYCHKLMQLNGRYENMPPSLFSKPSNLARSAASTSSHLSTQEAAPTIPSQTRSISPDSSSSSSSDSQRHDDGKEKVTGRDHLKRSISPERSGSSSRRNRSDELQTRFV